MKKKYLFLFLMLFLVSREVYSQLNYTKYFLITGSAEYYLHLGEFKSAFFIRKKRLSQGVQKGI